MRIRLLILAFFFTAVSFAQLELEHIYNDAVVTRVKFETWGEKYYLLRRATNELVFYNADHTLWKTVVLPASAPTMYTGTTIFHVSETEINPDANIEILFGHYNHTGVYYECKVVTDSGDVLATIPHAYWATLNKIPGLPGKLITKNTLSLPLSKVYSLPELNFEKAYNTGDINRINLENSGEKYYLLNKSTNQVQLYNADHSEWKTVNLSKPGNAVYTEPGINFMSEKQINGDGLLEIGYSYYSVAAGVYTYESKIVDESGNTLLALPAASSLRIDLLEGAPDKLFATMVHHDDMIGQYYASNVYGLPELALEKEYETQVARVVLENSGEKYYTSQNLTSGDVKIYNQDHTLWKTVSLNVQNGNNVSASVFCVSETKFADDPLLEIGYCYVYHSPLMVDEWHGQLINEEGLTYLDLPDAQSLTLSELPGLPNKLISTHAIPDTFGDTAYYHGEVYSIDATMATDGFQNNIAVSLAPNPAASLLQIHSNARIVEAVLYNISGSEVQHLNAPEINAIDVGQLETGMYFLTLRDDSNQQSVHKVLVSH